MPEFGEFFGKITKPVRRFFNPPMTDSQRSEAERKAKGIIRAEDISNVSNDNIIGKVRGEFGSAGNSPSLNPLIGYGYNPVIVDHDAQELNKENARSPQDVAAEIKEKNKEKLRQDDERRK